MKCQRTGVRRLVEQKLTLEVTFFNLNLVPLIFNIPIICSNCHFTCSNFNYGPSMMLQKKTPWKDPRGSLYLLRSLSRHISLERPLRSNNIPLQGPVARCLSKESFPVKSYRFLVYVCKFWM